MKVWGHAEFLSASERQQIHQAVLRILDEVGLVVENDRLLERLAVAGARVDRQAQRVTFAPGYIETFLADSIRTDAAVTPRVSGLSGAYYGHYLNPDTGKYETWNTARVLHYLKIAHHLEHTSPFLSVILPLEDVPPEVLTPFFHYLTFKYFGRSACGMDEQRWSPCILEMCETVAGQTNRPLGEVFTGYVFLIAPLKLGRQEADLLEYWAQRGVPLAIGNMTSAGGTAPVTLAGAVAQHLAQEFAILILRRVCFGIRELTFGFSISALDMRTGMFPYGRPERVLANLAMMDMARYYRGRYGPMRAQSDAKLPCTEAGFQKGLSAMSTLMAGGSATVACGTLSVDEVFSPIQMVIDNEMVSVLKYLARGFEVNEQTLALETIKEVGPGGQYLAAEHTAENFRQAVWEPQIFAREMFASWRNHGSRFDVDYALDIYRDLATREPLPARIPESLDRKLLDILRKHIGPCDLPRV